MSFFDLIRELRKGEPNIKKSAKAMRILGWICVIGAVWNFAIYFIGPFEESPFNIPDHYPYLALIILLSLGAAFFHSARGISDGASWGKKLGQLAVVLLVGVVIGATFFIFPDDAIPSEPQGVSIIFIIFMVIFSAQFFVPAYFGVRYLGRLPLKGNVYPDHRFESDTISSARPNRTDMGGQTAHDKYKDALLPFGVIGTFALLIAIPMLVILIVEKFARPEGLPILFAPTFFLVFFSPIIYNYIPSPFERERDIISKHTGGGSIFLFSGSWPFFRLLIYSDGVEVRVMLHRFFIPYDKLEDLPGKIGFFSRGILIKSDLPGVPSNIRFFGFGMKKILNEMNEIRSQFKAST